MVMHELIGKKVLTDSGFGEAVVSLYIEEKGWFKIDYPDGSMGWVTRQQIKEVKGGGCQDDIDCACDDLGSTCCVCEDDY